jgi:hypothetical protein
MSVEVHKPVIFELGDYDATFTLDIEDKEFNEALHQLQNDVAEQKALVEQLKAELAAIHIEPPNPPPSPPVPVDPPHPPPNPPVPVDPPHPPPHPASDFERIVSDVDTTTAFAEKATIDGNKITADQ